MFKINKFMEIFQRKRTINNLKKLRNLRKKLLIGAAAITLLIVAGCSPKKETTTIDIPSATPVSFGELFTVDFDAEDIDASFTDSIRITLEGNSISTKANVTYANNQVVIAEGGTYELTGTLTNGQIYVNTQETVRLVLNGVTIHNETGPALEIENAEKTIIILAAESENNLSDGANYQLEAGLDEPNATLYSKTDVSITGTGTLTITANYQNGILTKDDLKITSGTFFITAVNDTIRGRDSVAILDGTFTLTAQGDGIQANHNEDATKGWVAINGGTFAIQSMGDGIQAETMLQILGGDITITTAENATGSSNKGIKGVGETYLAHGNYTVTSVDDAIHSNASITIASGTYTLQSQDDGIHADANLTINDGTINILESYEGLEGSNITINGGQINLVASDDGINAAGGNDTTTGPTDMFAAGDHAITINGGVIQVNAQGDGIDANGNLNFNGGDIIVHGPSDNGNGSLDYDGQSSITGGTLIAYGSGGMAQTPGTDSTQNVLEVKTTTTYGAGTTITIKDAAGNDIIGFTAQKNFASVVFSTNKLVLGETYHIYINGTETGTTTLTSNVQYINETGTAQMGGNNTGPGQFGNMGPGNNNRPLPRV